MLKSLAKAVTATVLLPVAVVVDVATFPLVADQQRKSMIGKTLKNIGDNVEKAIDTTKR